MSDEYAEVEQIARAFHEVYERTAPKVSYRTNPESAVPWEQVPHVNKILMLATVKQLLALGVIEVGPTPEKRWP